MKSYENRKIAIGDRIRAEREKRGLKMKEFLPQIYKSEQSYKTLAAWENGERLPDLDSLTRMAEIFDCDVGYLLCDYDEHRRTTSDVCAETGLSEQAAQWIIGLHRAETLSNDLSNQLLNALSRLITSESFSLILRDLVLLDECVQRAQSQRPAKNFGDIFSQLFHVQNAKAELKDDNDHIIAQTRDFADTIRFRLNKTFNNVVDEISKEC